MWSHYNEGINRIDLSLLDKSDEKIEYKMNAIEDIPDFEILIQNKSDSQIQIEDIRIEILDDDRQEMK